VYQFALITFSAFPDYFLMEFLMILIAATKSKNPNKSYTEKNCLRKASIVT